MTRLVRGAVVGLVLGAGTLVQGACGGTCGFGVADTIFQPVLSARYGTTVEEAPGVAFPWMEAAGIVDVVIDRDAEVVVVSYERDGAVVEERWKVTASR